MLVKQFCKMSRHYYKLGFKLCRIEDKERNMMIHRIHKCGQSNWSREAPLFLVLTPERSVFPLGSSQRGIYSSTNKHLSDGLLVISMHNLNVPFLERSSICSIDILPKDGSKMKICGWPTCQVHDLCQFGVTWNSYCNIWSSGAQPCLCGKSPEVFLNVDTFVLYP